MTAKTEKFVKGLNGNKWFLAGIAVLGILATILVFILDGFKDEAEKAAVTATAADKKAEKACTKADGLETRFDEYLTTAKEWRDEDRKKWSEQMAHNREQRECVRKIYELVKDK